MKTFSIFTAMLTAATALVFLGWELVIAEEETLPARRNPAHSGLRARSDSYSYADSLALAQKTKPGAKSGGKEKPPNEKPKEKVQNSQNPNLDANNRLNETRRRMREYKTYATTIRQFIKIGDRSFTATGRFYRKAIESRGRLSRSPSRMPPGLYYPGQEEKIRLELKLELNTGYHKIKGSLLQVCDGEVLMTVQKIGDQERVSRRNVKEILAALSGSASNNGTNVNFRQSLICELGLGGVTGMLASLQKVMVFDTYGTRKIKNGKVYVIEGTWNPTYQRHWKGTTNQAAALPVHTPDRVRIIVDSASHLRRIEYLKRSADSEKFEPMITINFELIKLNKPLSDNLFRFKRPTGVRVERLTKVYTRQLNPLQKQPPGSR